MRPILHKDGTATLLNPRTQQQERSARPSAQALEALSPEVRRQVEVHCGISRPELSSFAEAVVKARDAKGWSNYRIAQETGCGNSTVADIVAGRRNPSLEVAALIALKLGIETKLMDFARPGGE
jgi:ribosome-binding protein aMBF1 (putative translation factor)